MSTSVTGLTPATAPRDPSILSTLGRYRLRLLAEDLGILDTEQKKMAFLALTPDRMGQDVFDGLRHWDSNQKVPTAQEATSAVLEVLAPEAELTIQPPTPVIVTEIHVPAREPVNNGRATRKRAEPANTASGDIGELTKAISTLSQQLPSLKAPDYSDTLAGVITMLQIVNTTQKATFSLLCLLADEIVNKSRLDILRATVADMDENMSDVENLINPPAPVGEEDSDEGKA